MIMRTVLSACFAVAMTIGIGATSPAFAHGYKLGAIDITHPWARATPKGAKVAGGYMTLVNTGADADRLVAVSTPAAGRVELHEMAVENGIMRMRPLAQGIAIPAGETVTLAPGGLHVMFLDLAGPLTEGKRFSGQLVFEKAGTIDVEFAVEAMAARGSKHDHHGKGGHGGH